MPDIGDAEGVTDLDAMLASLTVERRPGTYTFVSGDWPRLRVHAAATIHEIEGETLVVLADDALAVGAPVEFNAAWLTLTVHSSLEAVGLTASVSRVLADAGIACNMLAGYFHDHLLVPTDRADDAVAALQTLRTR